MKTNVFVLSIGILILCLALTPGAALAGRSGFMLSAPTQVQRISTLEILPYSPFQASNSHLKELWSGNLPEPFTYNVGSFGVDHISNLTYTSTGGAACVHNSSLLITCNGILTQIEIDFDYTYVTNDYQGQLIWFGFSGASDFPVDYTFILKYPAPLVYVRPYTLQPTSVTGSQIIWNLTNTKSLPGAALFSDARVKVLNLPIGMR
jgi:hypothetical protein